MPNYRVTTPNGTDSLNGTYIDSGVHNDRPYYIKSGGGAYLYWNNKWLIGTVLGDPAGSSSGHTPSMWAEAHNGATYPSDSTYFGANDHQDPSVVVTHATPPGLKITNITSDGYVIHEPSPWNLDWNPEGLITFKPDQVNNEGVFAQGFGTALILFANEVVPAGTNYERNWRFRPSDGSGELAGPPTVFDRPSIAGTPTNTTATTATVSIFGPVAPCVTAVIAQIRKVGTEIWSSFAATAGQSHEFQGLEVGTYEWRVRLEFPAAAGGDGFAHGQATTFQTSLPEPEPEPEPDPEPVDDGCPTSTGALAISKITSGSVQLIAPAYLPVSNSNFYIRMVQLSGENPATIEVGWIQKGEPRTVFNLLPSTDYSITLYVQKYGCPEVTSHYTFTTLAASGTDPQTPNEPPSTTPPDSPGELEGLRIGGTSIRILTPPLPARAASITIQIYDGTNWVTQSTGHLGSVIVNIGGRTLNTSYRFRALAVNSAGSTPGEPLWVRTLSTGGDGATLPAKPTTPTATKRANQATLSYEEWPEGAEQVHLLQDGIVVHTWDFIEDQPKYLHIASPLADFNTYIFRLQGSNEVGLGPESDPVLVTMVSDTLVVTWEHPTNGQTIAGRIGLVVSLNMAGQSVRLTAGGGDLPGVEKIGGVNRYTALYDTTYMTAMGVMTFSATAKDHLGLFAPLSIITLNISNSLARLTHYEHIRWREPDQKKLRTLLLGTIIDSTEPHQWIDALVSSPGKGTPLQYNDYAAMETELRSWQEVPFDEPFEIIHGATSSDTIEVVLRFTPTRLETRYQTGATQGKRLRKISDTQLEALTADPAKVFRVNGDGLSLILDLSTRDFGEAIDAKVWREDKVVAIQGDEIKVCEIDSSSRDWYVRIEDEMKEPFAVESDGDNFYLFYTDLTGTTCWKHDGTDPVKLFDYPDEINLVRMYGKCIAFTTIDDHLCQASTETGTPVRLREHTAAITDIYIKDDKIDSYSDYRAVWVPQTGVFTESALSPVNIRSLSTYRGFNLIKQPAVGTLSHQIYSVDPNGGFSSTWGVSGQVESVEGLGTLDVVYVPEEGDPLMGGKPAVTSEILVALVSSTVEAGGFVAYIEQSKRTAETSLKAGGIRTLVVLPENQRKS